MLTQLSYYYFPWIPFLIWVSVSKGHQDSAGILILVVVVVGTCTFFQKVTSGKDLATSFCVLNLSLCRKLLTVKGSK